MAVEKGLLTAAGVAFVGFVGYKIIKKKKPKWIENARKSISDAQEGAAKLIEGAKESFREGYASA